jgi:hypothetical protein
MTDYQECWTVVRVRDDDQDGFAAARFGRGGVYGPQWRLLGWLQESVTDYRSAIRHGTAVKGAHGFAQDLFPSRSWRRSD